MSDTQLPPHATIVASGKSSMADGSEAVAEHGAATQFVTTQPTGEWLARVFLGAYVQDQKGHKVGDINDLLFDRTGRITTAVLGVGGMLGIGEKSVAVPFGSLTVTESENGSRVIVVAIGKDALEQAPAFKATEKTTLDVVRDRAIDIGHKTADKAVELKDQAAKKIVDMTKPPG